jgi:hypothetical protein
MAENNSDMEARRAVRKELQGLAKEMGYAVNSIRQEVVERPWFKETVTPEIVSEWDKESPNAEEKELEGAQDFSREDLYGKEQGDKDVERDDLYGKDPDIEDGREHVRDDDMEI